MGKGGKAGQATDDYIIECMRFVSRINKAICRHSEYVINIAFPRQQLLRERVYFSGYIYTACLRLLGCSSHPVSAAPNN